MSLNFARLWTIDGFPGRCLALPLSIVRARQRGAEGTAELARLQEELDGHIEMVGVKFSSRSGSSRLIGSAGRFVLAAHSHVHVSRKPTYSR